MKNVFRKIVYVIVFPLSVVISLTVQAIDVGDSFGGLKGRVNFCGKGGVEGMLVMVPGRQFVVVTDNTGVFLFDFLPVGQYDIHYILNGKKLNHNNGIKVREGQVVQLGVISFCMENISATPSSVAPIPASPSSSTSVVNNNGNEGNGKEDKDNDGIIASNDCNDNNSSIRPGALEICDGVDNNCSGKIDDMGEFTIEHAWATCLNGQAKIARCDENFADCDLDVSNGCEVDLYSDGENCGSCGNECSGLEMCALGSC